jgi:hypothetical protein
MSKDTIEGLSAELASQERTSAKLLALLRKIEAMAPTMPRVGQMIEQVRQTQQTEDETRRMLEQKKGEAR